MIFLFGESFVIADIKIDMEFLKLFLVNNAVTMNNFLLINSLAGIVT